MCDGSPGQEAVPWFWAAQTLAASNPVLPVGQIVRHVQIPGVNTSGVYSNPALSPDGITIYFSNNNTLYTFNAKTLALTNTVPGIALVNLSVSPDGGYLYGATQQSLQIVSTSLLQVVGTIPSAYQPGPALFLGS